MKDRSSNRPWARLSARIIRIAGCLLVWAVLASVVDATPANKAAFESHFGAFLKPALDRCVTCHLPSDNKAPETLEEFPHNPFGVRLRQVAEEMKPGGAKTDIPARLRFVAREDSDGDGVENEVEILLGHNPGDAKDRPSRSELREIGAVRRAFGKELASSPWEPFQPVLRPPLPAVKTRAWSRNPIDRFISARHAERGLKPRPEAASEILLRRVYLDVIGLSPTVEEQRQFARDPSPDAYEKVVERLLEDPRYGERWGRHWMDVWRYSDWAGWTDGGQVRDSKPHIWRWRDWIVESLNADKGYDQMILEMLAADELAPEDTNTLRATGFLVRNYKMLSREQWMEDTVKHTSQAFLGLTVGCAKCHDHRYDPISQNEYYQLRAIFEPHQVRTDRVPGQLDVLKDGLVRVFDADPGGLTYFFPRGDERKPDTNRVVQPAALKILGGHFEFKSVPLPSLAAFPDKRDFVRRDLIAAAEAAVAEARAAVEKSKLEKEPGVGKLAELPMRLEIAEAKLASLRAVIRTEELDGERDSEEWKKAAEVVSGAQRALALSEARLKQHQARVAEVESEKKADLARTALGTMPLEDGAEGARAEAAPKLKEALEKAEKELETARQKTAEAEKTLAMARTEAEAPPTTAFQPRAIEAFPAVSTGRRLGFARWLVRPDNPLTARVAVNHIWLRHFGVGLVPTPADFGRNGRRPTHPELLDWLAAELMARNWSMKSIHRLILTSQTYRMASTGERVGLRIDPDNLWLWRMPSRRLEAEAVRDNILHVSGALDPAMGGPEIDHRKGLASRRRSIYFRIAAEKEVEFLKIFDSPSVTECYERRPSVMPQQALALSNSELTLNQARSLARELTLQTGTDRARFVELAYRRILAREPAPEEIRLCSEFLESPRKGADLRSVEAPGVAAEGTKPGDDAARKARENLVLVLFNHNDFVTVR